jgi:transcriptional regulator with XRE-family HTH domain
VTSTSAAGNSPKSLDTVVANLRERPLRVTERLKEARESRGLSHRQIADVTKVSARVVAALEDGRLDVVPEGIYRRSLVRLMASEVGLNPEETLREFLAEHPDDLAAPGEPALVDATKRTATGRWRRVLPMIGAVIPLAVGVAYFARPFPSAYRTLVLTPESVSAGGVWRPDIVPAGGFTEPPPPQARPMSVLLTVSERCRLEVVADGGLVVGRTFEAGESVRVAFSDSVELSGDNAGGVQFSINGRGGRLLGGSGEALAARLGRDDYPSFLSGR